MSKSEFARFVADLGTDTALQAAAKTNSSDAAALVAMARSKGYAIDIEDVRGHLKATQPALTEKELDAVSAGKSAAKIVVIPTIL